MECGSSLYLELTQSLSTFYAEKINDSHRIASETAVSPSFLMRTAGGWNALTLSLFLVNYNLNIFKTKLKKYLLGLHASSSAASSLTSGKLATKRRLTLFFV